MLHKKAPGWEHSWLRAGGGRYDFVGSKPEQGQQADEEAAPRP